MLVRDKRNEKSGNKKDVNMTTPGPHIRVRNRKLLFLFLNQTICCGYSKEPSR